MIHIYKYTILKFGQEANMNKNETFSRIAWYVTTYHRYWLKEIGNTHPHLTTWDWTHRFVFIIFNFIILYLFIYCFLIFNFLIFNFWYYLTTKYNIFEKFIILALRFSVFRVKNKLKVGENVLQIRSILFIIFLYIYYIWRLKFYLKWKD